MVNGYTKACCANEIAGAFRRAGIVTEMHETGQAVMGRVDLEEAKGVRHIGKNKRRIRLIRSEHLGGEDEEQFVEE
jgi:hypothetical protein